MLLIGVFRDVNGICSSVLQYDVVNWSLYSRICVFSFSNISSMRLSWLTGRWVTLMTSGSLTPLICFSTHTYTHRQTCVTVCGLAVIALLHCVIISQCNVVIYMRPTTALSMTVCMCVCVCVCVTNTQWIATHTAIWRHTSSMQLNRCWETGDDL